MSESPEQVTEESITRCICGFTHDDGYMIWCDGCSVWQHLSCMELDPSSLPEVYYCEICQPRPVNSERAKRIQRHFRTSDTSGSGDDADVTSHRMTSLSFTEETPTTSKAESAPRLHPFHKKHSKRHKHHSPSSEMSTLPSADTGSTPAKPFKPSKTFKPYSRSNSNNPGPEQQGVESVLAEEVSALWHSQAKHYSSNELRDTHVLSESVQSLVARTCAMPERDPQVVFTSGEGRGGSTPPRAVGCTLQLVQRKRKGIFTTTNTVTDQLIVELKGNVLDGDTLLHKEGLHPNALNKDSLTPFILSYKGLGKHSIYIDSRAYDNKARHVRRCCEPNAIVRHFILDSHLKFGIFAKTNISKAHEVTIPHDFPIQSCDYLVECGCGFKGSRCPARSHNLCLKKKLSQSQQDREERATPDTTIKMDSVCSVPTEDDLSPLPLVSPRKRKRHRIESDSISHLPHSTATTPVQESPGGAKKSREDRKLEGVMKLFEKMERQPSHPHRKSSSQEEPPVFSPTPKTVASPSFKQRRSSVSEKRAKRHGSHKKSGSFSAEESVAVSSHRTLEGKTASLPQEGGVTPCGSPPSVFEKTPLKKLLLHQWEEEFRGMEAERKREVLFPDGPDQPSHRLEFPPHPFSDEGEYHFSKWGYTLTPDTSLYEFRGAPKKHCISALPPPSDPPTLQREGEGNEGQDEDWIKRLPIKKQLVYRFKRQEQQRLEWEKRREEEEEARKRELEAERRRVEENQEGEDRSETEERGSDSQIDATSDISVESEEKPASSDVDVEQDDITPVDSPPLVHSTTSDQPIPPTDMEYMSPLPVEYSPSPPHSPDPVSPFSAASSPISPKTPHTPSPDPPLLSPPGHLPRMDSCISQVSSTLDSPRQQNIDKSLVPAYIPTSPSLVRTGDRHRAPQMETLSPPAPLITQDISPAEEMVPSTLPLPVPTRKPRPQLPNNARYSSELTKASSLDSDMGSRHPPDPSYRRSAPYSHLSPRFDTFYPSSRHSSSPELRHIATSTALKADLHRPDSSPFQVISPLSISSPSQRPIDTRIELPVRMESPSMDTDTPITPVESFTPLSESGPRADGSNISASGKRVVTLEEYRKRREQTRASSASSQLLSHVLSPGHSHSHTPPPALSERERVRGNSSAGISESSFWGESRREKDRRQDRHHWDSHSRHHGKESSHRHKDRHRDKHRGRGHRDRERERDRHEERRQYHQHRENRRRTSSSAYEEGRTRHAQTQPPPASHPVEIEPVSPDDTQQTEAVSVYERRYSTPLPLPLPLPPESCRMNDSISTLMTLTVLLGPKSEKNKS